MQKLFTNGNIVDLKTGKVCKCDILVENGKIVNIGKVSDFEGEVIDLNENYVLPNFVNVFCHSLRAFEMCYGEISSSNDISDKIAKLMFAKNILSGAFFNDLANNDYRFALLEDVENLDEKQLSTFSDSVAKSGAKLFMKVGQNLEELGFVDKTYKKTLSQLLEDFGFLDRKSVVVGGNCFEKDELQIFSQYDCDFCLTVGEDGKFGKRPTNVLSLKSLDFCVGLGSGYSFEIDFFAFMRQILLTQRGLFEDENCVTEQEVLQMATLNGSKILTGEENLLKCGNFANFIVVEKGESLYDDIFKTLVWEKSKRDVVLTVFKGDILQKNGKILMKNWGDYATIIKDIKKILRRN